MLTLWCFLWLLSALPVSSFTAIFSYYGWKWRPHIVMFPNYWVLHLFKWTSNRTHNIRCSHSLFHSTFHTTVKGQKCHIQGHFNNLPKIQRHDVPCAVMLCPKPSTQFSHFYITTCCIWLWVWVSKHLMGKAQLGLKGNFSNEVTMKYVRSLIHSSHP